KADFPEYRSGQHKPDSYSQRLCRQRWFAQTNNESAYTIGWGCYNLEAHETHRVREERRKQPAEARKKRWSKKSIRRDSGISPGSSARYICPCRDRITGFKTTAEAPVWDTAAV